MESLITVREAAKECRRTPETVRRWIWDGKLPAQKLGNQLFVKREDLARCGCGTERPGKPDRLAALDKAVQNCERIRRRVGGDFDVLELLDRSRESHP